MQREIANEGGVVVRGGKLIGRSIIEKNVVQIEN
jgi:hypothetical protein